jgi:hypothetical protein
VAEDDPFADLGETLEGGESADAEESTASDATGEQGADSDAVDPVTDAAFTYETATQRPFYAREGTIEEFDSWLTYELERELSERGYRNIVVREMTDALLRTVVEEDLTEAVARRFEQARTDGADRS